MKPYEAFEILRNRKNDGFGLRLRLVLLVTCEIIVSVLLAMGISELLNWALPESGIPLLVELLVLSLIVGFFVTYFMGKMFFTPIKRLGNAMRSVADGDFAVQLETKKTTPKEVQEVYSGFNMMTNELKATEMLQSDFVSNVSHEFKTPINAIEGYATLLQGCEGLDEDHEEYIEKILFNTRRLSTLVGNILLLSKIENKNLPTNNVKFRLDEQIRQSVLALEPSWTAKNIDFDIELDEIEYFGNEPLLHHVWDNLISNAIKFSPEGGLVLLRLQDCDGGVMFCVEDSGPGISENAKKHIYDKFYQADSSHKEEGNGLGLALVKRILEITNGLISVENVASGGCRFTVVLK